MSITMPIKPCQDESGNPFSPVVYEESLFRADGTKMNNLVTQNEIAEAYDPTKTYPTQSQYCIEDNKFYVYSGASGTTTTGAFDSTKWTETSAAAIFSAINSSLTDTTRRTRKNITTNLSNLSTAVSEQNLAKYGYAIGDYFNGASGYTYHLADMDTFYGGYTSNAVVATHHIGIVVDTKTTSKWANSNDTSGGYVNSTLQSFLAGTVLNNIKSDFKTLFGGSTGLEHLLSHNKLFSTGTSAWAWSNGIYISALSEVQVYGSTIWSMNGYQEGECCRKIELFNKFRFNEIIGNAWFWLRNIQSATYACYASYGGHANYAGASSACRAVGLILFH